MKFDLTTPTQFDNESIPLLFGLANDNVKFLKKYGFEYDFENRCFKTEICINDIQYTAYIYRQDGHGLKTYYITIKNSNNKYVNETVHELKGVNDLYIHTDAKIQISEIRTSAFILWLRNIYNLNAKGKESFKEFVENEKQKE